VVNDWEPDRTGPAVAADVLSGIRTHGDGAVVLLHTWPGATADGLPLILDGLRTSDVTTVTVDELEEVP
jgi:peptidoglycan/xylan/chitin deacetylase (PgdA/CDA1 family)